MTKKKTVKTRSRIAILNTIISFSTATKYSDGDVVVHHRDYAFIGRKDREYPPIGSLCRLVSAPMDTQFYLCWLHSVTPMPRGDTEYLMESIEDGSMCKWSNVEVKFIDPAITDVHPEWRWTDEQWIFWDIVKKAHESSGVFLQPMMPQFYPDNDYVTLLTRERFKDTIFTEQSFDKWLNLSNTRIRKFFLESQKKWDNEFIKQKKRAKQ